MKSDTLKAKAFKAAINSGLLKPGMVFDISYSGARLRELNQGYMLIRNSADLSISPTLTTRCDNFAICVEG